MYDFFCFKQRTAYEVRISDWSSDVCSSDLLQRPFAQLDLEHLQMVARLDVVGVRQHDAAFQARAHFGDIVLETAQRGDGRRRDDDVLAREARVEPLADDAFEHQQARGLVALAGREDLLDLGSADDGLRSEEPKSQ